MKEKVDRFERILKTRVKGREEEQLLLAGQKSEEEQIVTRLDTLRSQKERALVSFSMQQGTLISPQDMWFQRKSIDVIEKHICDGDSSLCDVRQEIEATEVHLVEKHREEKKKKKYISSIVEEWRTTLQKNEQTEMDDIAGIRHGSHGRKNQ